MTKEAPPIGQVAPEVALNVAKVVDAALRFDKKARWVDANAMQAAVRHAYHDRHGTPITTAPKLTVPPSVPNRTLPSAQGTLAARLSSTGQPVESGRRLEVGLANVIRSKQLRLVAVVFGGAATVGIIAAVAVVGLSGRHGETSISGAMPSLVPPPVVAAVGPTTTPSASAVASSSASILPTLPSTARPNAGSKPGGSSRVAPLGTATRAPSASAPPATAAPPPPTPKPPCPVDPNTGLPIWTKECAQ